MNAVVETVSDTSSSDSEAELLLQDIKPEENNHNTHDCYKYDSCSEPEKSSCPDQMELEEHHNHHLSVVSLLSVQHVLFHCGALLPR